MYTQNGRRAYVISPDPAHAYKRVCARAHVYGCVSVRAPLLMCVTATSDTHIHDTSHTRTSHVPHTHKPCVKSHS